jgi:beta-1,4-mannosyl-glycoprotein beta-1,4-N-acetylglucosaminyltransferase
MTGRTLRELGGPQYARLPAGNIVHGDGYGWHLSYMGGPDAIARKIRGAAHAELDRPEYTDPDLIARRLAVGADLFDRPDRFCQWVGLNQLPRAVQSNFARYEHLMIASP